MLQGRNIAFFIDVDNVGLTSEQYANIIEQLKGMGTILSGKVYGAGDRKHKEIYDDADLRGYTMARPMRIKRRGRKDFDARIFVDVTDAVAHVPAIDAVCIIAEPTDLVHLYSYLRSHGVKVIALDNADAASCALIDEVIDIGAVVELKLPKKPAAKPAPKAEPAKVEPAPVKQEPVKEVKEQRAPVKEKVELDRTDELLKEIERLRALANAPVTEAAPAPQEEPIAEPAPEPVVEEPVAEPAPEPIAEQPAPASAPRATYAPSNDSDLVRRIEEIRRSNQGDDEDFLDEIRKLLDGLD